MSPAFKPLMSDGLDLPLEQDCPYQSSPERGNDTRRLSAGAVVRGDSNGRERRSVASTASLVFLHQGFPVPSLLPSLETGRRTTACLSRSRRER